MSTYVSQADITSPNMDDKQDVDKIGRHCQVCREKDFLPTRCDSCWGWFCQPHSKEDSHACPQKGLAARRRREKELKGSNVALPSTEKPSLLTAKQCSSPQCKEFVNTTLKPGVLCSTCNRTYCLGHRFPEEHDCKNLVPLGARPADIAFKANKEKLRLGFGRLKVWGQEKKDTLAKQVTPTPKPTSKAAQLLALNKMKKEATGDAKVPVEKRLYLHCSATDKVTKDGKPKEASMWFNEDWKIGRILDLVATKLGVENLNNSAQETDKILRVYHIESGEVLEFSEKVSQRMISGNSVVLIRGLEV